MAEFGIYIGDVTEGKTDGTLVTDGNPIQAVLPLGKQTFKFIKFAFRPAYEYKVTELQITITGTNAGAWFIKEYQDGETADNLEMSGRFSNSYFNTADYYPQNKLFWLAVAVNPDETEHTDNCKLCVKCKCEKVM